MALRVRSFVKHANVWVKESHLLTYSHIHNMQIKLKIQINKLVNLVKNICVESFDCKIQYGDEFHLYVCVSDLIKFLLSCFCCCVVTLNVFI